MLAKTAKAAESGKFELYKTSHHSMAHTRTRSGSARAALIVAAEAYTGASFRTLPFLPAARRDLARPPKNPREILHPA